MRPAAICVICVGLGGGALPLGQEPSQRPVFRTGTEAVTIDVSVRRRNAPVAGLTLHDFELLDNGVPQAIELQTIDTVPVDVSLVFDQTYFSQAWIGSRFASDLTKIAAVLRPIDRLRVITFATDVREVVPMRAEGSSETKRLSDVTPSQTIATLRRAGRLGKSGFDLMYDPKLRRWSLFDALLLALARPPELGRRHLVIAFCIGVDSASVLMDGTLFDMVAARTDALLHVALWNRRRSPGWTLEGLRGQYTRFAVTAAAIATGGDVHDAADGVSAFKSIFEGFRQSYILQYTVTGVPRGGWHTVVVRTPRFPNYDVRARKGYMGR